MQPKTYRFIKAFEVSENQRYNTPFTMVECRYIIEFRLLGLCWMRPPNVNRVKDQKHASSEFKNRMTVCVNIIDSEYRSKRI